MLIVYLSLSGNVRSFVNRIGMNNVEINYSNPLTEVNEDYILITPTYDDEITDIVSDFIDYKNNMSHLVGFVGSGNLNFNEGYCFNAKNLSKKYNKPLIFTFEFSGTDNDVMELKKEVYRVGITRATKES
jgi:protein involved in ribonucleotide reduction